MSEFRRARRRKVADVINVHDTMTDQVVGRIGNLSETGMLVVSNHAGHDDALFQLRFQLPMGGGALHTVDVGAHLLWSELTLPPSTFWTGYRFIDIGPADLEQLRQWIEQPGASYA